MGWVSSDPVRAQGAAATWRSVGPEGGTVTALYADPLDNDRVFIGTRGGNVYGSVDGGASWRQVADDLYATWVHQLAGSSAPGSQLYARTDQGLFRWRPSNPSWERLSVPSDRRVRTIAVEPGSGNPRELYALAENDGVLRCCTLWASRDGGETWTERNDESLYSTSLAVLATEPRTLIGTGAGGFLRSTDGGMTWTQSSGLDAVLSEPIQFFPHPVDPSVVYAQATAVDRELLVFLDERIFKSVDAGQSWSGMGEGLPDRVLFGEFSLAIDPERPTLLFAEDWSGVYRSDDGGESFVEDPTSQNQLGESTALSRLAFSADGDQLFGARGRHASEPVAATPWPLEDWSFADTSLPASSIEQLLAHPDVSGDWIVLLSDGRVLRTGDSGDEWTESAASILEDRSALALARSPSEPRRVLMASASRSTVTGDLDVRIHRSRDGGLTWEDVATLTGELAGARVQQIHFDPLESSRATLLLISGDRASSQDFGSTWELVGGSPCDFARDLAISPIDPSVMIVGCVRDSGIPVSPPIHHSDIWRTTDGGETWSLAQDTIVGMVGRDGWAFAFDEEQPGLVYAGLAVFSSNDEGIVLRSEDAGESWSFEPAAGTGAALTLAAAGGDAVLGSASLGVFRRSSSGGWESISSGLNARAVKVAGYDGGSSGRLLAGTLGGGVQVLDPPPGCIADEISFCLLDRFRVSATWLDALGNEHAAVSRSLADGTGSFWFFEPNNLELVVKMIDGRSVNEHFWLYAAALSDVQYSIRLEDTVTGFVRTYESEAGTIRSLADVEAIPEAAPSGAALASSRQVSSGQVSSGQSPSSPRASPAAAAGAFEIGPFRLEIDWTLGSGDEGLASAVAINELSGAFWFFDPESYDVFAKVLDGRAINGHYWLFVGSLTDVGFSLRVTDTETGEVRTYVNPVGSLAGFLDLELSSGGS